MRCLSCQREVGAPDSEIVLSIYLCKSCAALAKKAVTELEKESARALFLAKDVLAEHIMRGGLLRTADPEAR